MAEGEQANSSHFLVENKSAKPICEGTDYRQLSLREQYSSSTSAEDPLNLTDEYLLGDFDALDEQVQATFNPLVSDRQLINSTASGQGLINVQVTPEILAQLMQQKHVDQSKQAPTQVNQGSQMLQPPPVVQRQLHVPAAPQTQTTGTFFHTLPLMNRCPKAPTSNDSAHLNNLQNFSSSSTPLLDEFHHTVISFPTPDKPIANQKKLTPKSSKLNTPKDSPPENILNQLLGNLPDSPAFSAIEQHSNRGKTKPAAPVSVATKSVQTEVYSEPEPKKSRKDEDPESGKVMLEALGKITAAIDWNSRAIRNQDRTIAQVVNVLTKLEKSVGCIADELHKKDSQHKGKENTGSPNRKVPKSIVKKK